MSLRGDLRQIWALGGLSVGTLAKRVYNEMGADEISGYAAQLAYYFLFSLFPFFLFLAALLPYVPIPNLLDQIMTLAGGLLPAAAMEMVQDNIVSLVSEPRGGLLSVGIGLALWSASSAFVAMATSLNRAYGVKEGRPFWKVRGLAIVLTVGLAVLIISSMILLIFGPELGGWLADYVGLGQAFDVFWNIARWPVIVILMMVAIALVYYFAPDVEQDWHWITPGAIFAVLAWIGLSLLFGYYVENFGSYDKTYGSIGAVIVLLTWMYLSGLVLLVGGELNSEIEHAAVGGKSEGQKHMPRHTRRKRSDEILVKS
jgi:membrane protein